MRAGVVLGCGSGPNDGSPGSLQLLFYCMLDHSGFQVANWGRWHAALERLPESHKWVNWAEVLGLLLSSCMRGDWTDGAPFSLVIPCGPSSNEQGYSSPASTNC